MSPLRERPPVEVGILGMVVFIVSLSVLFTSTIVGMFLVEQSPGMWLPRGESWVRVGLGASTALLFANGVLLQRALTRVRRGELAGLTGLLTAASVLGVAFLAAQGVNWLQVYQAVDQAPASGGRPHGFFFVLTGLHALHVLGGVPAVIVTTLSARANRYTALDHDGLLYCTMYWHFLDGVWLTSLIVLLLSR